jgi:hypothetical protein
MGDVSARAMVAAKANAHAASMKKFRSITSLENPVEAIVYALIALEEILPKRKCNFYIS